MNETVELFENSSGHYAAQKYIHQHEVVVLSRRPSFQ